MEFQHDTFNERVVIASLFTVTTPNQAKLIRALRPENFLGAGHCEIWESARRALAAGLAVTPETVRQLGGSAVDLSLIRTLLAEFPDAPPSLDHHVSALLWDAQRARAIAGPLAELHRSLKDQTTKRERVQALAKQLARSFDGAGNRPYLEDGDSIIRAALRDIDNRQTQQAVYPYGIDGLDRCDDGSWRLVPGAAPGQITLVTALSGSGKSTLAAHIALGMASQKRKVLFGSWEMQSRVTLPLIAGIALRLSRYKVSTGKLDRAERSALERKMVELSQWIQFFKFPWGRDIGDRPRDNNEAVDRLHNYIADSGAEVVIADLLRRSFVDRSIDGEELALERMQVVAEETQTHHVWCHQQRLKDVEKRAATERRPTREGIKGSSQWVDVPDTIIGIHLPSLHANVPAETIELDILKQRYGRWPIAVEFDWDPDTAQISNARDVDYESPSCNVLSGIKF